MPYSFLFYTNNAQQPLFQCVLESLRCTANTRGGHRCSRQTVIGCGLCWSHLLSENHLRIKQSTLAGAGKGLFALNPRAADNTPIFRPNERIIRYDGELLTRQQVDDRYGVYTAPYAVQLGNNIVDAAKQRGVGCLANHKPHGRANARFAVGRIGGPHIVLIANRAIRNGDEIFVDYGHEYRLNDGSHHETKQVSRRRAEAIAEAEN